MRVIAGKMGGRKLQAPHGSLTRPTPDRVKEALFSILGHRLFNAHVLDLYAGSGALGIEALSRGAAHATFVEQDRAALAALQANMTATLGQASQMATVIPCTVQKALENLAQKQRQFELIFLDPPYAADLLTSTLQLLVQGNLVAPGATLVAEHSGKSPSPDAPPQLQCTGLRRYGDVALSFYRPGQASPTPQGASAP